MKAVRAHEVSDYFPKKVVLSPGEYIVCSTRTYFGDRLSLLFPMGDVIFIKGYHLLAVNKGPVFVIKANDQDSCSVIFVWGANDGFPRGWQTSAKNDPLFRIQ